MSEWNQALKMSRKIFELTGYQLRLDMQLPDFKKEDRKEDRNNEFDREGIQRSQYTAY